MEKIKKRMSEFLGKKEIKKWFRKENLIVLILMGVLLMVIAMPSEKLDNLLEKNGGSGGTVPEDPPGGQTKQDTWGTGSPAAGDLGWSDGEEESAKGDGAEKGSGSVSDRSGLEEYTAHLEERLTQLLNGIDGVGKVRVMITLQSSEELVLEKDMPIVRSNTTESDAEGGSRSVYQVDSGESTVYAEEDGMRTPFVVKTLTPRIEGVVVVAQGAGTARLSADISEAVQALFGIEAHKVKVIRMADE